MFVSLVLLSVGLCLGNVSGRNITSNFYREESCAKVHGFCVLGDECDESVDEDTKKLCPGQKSEGAVCCKGFPAGDANCFQLHNGCTNTCPDHLNLGGKGCPEGEICCVLT